MPAGPERRETNRLVEDIKRKYPRAFVWKVFGGPYGGGIPDLCVIVDGVTWWIEMKMRPRKITPKQRETIERMVIAGANVIVMTIEEEVPGKKWFAVVETHLVGGIFAENHARRRGETWDVERILASPPTEAGAPAEAGGATAGAAGAAAGTPPGHEE